MTRIGWARWVALALVLSAPRSEAGAPGKATAPHALFPVQCGEKIAFVDVRGRVAVPALFDVAETFSEGFARIAIQEGDKLVQGYLDASGKVALKLPYPAVYRFSEGLARVRTTQDRFDLFGFIDRTGKLVIAPQFVQARDFKDGKAWAQTDPEDPPVWIDKSGRRLTGLAGDGELAYYDGLAVTEVEGLAGYVDAKAKIVVPPRYTKALPFSEGLGLGLLGDSGKWDLLDPAGKVLATLGYSSVRAFHDGMARVSVGLGKGEKWGFIDKAARLVIAAEYDYAADFSEGLAQVEFEHKWGFIDRTGKRVIPPRFDNAGSFDGGLARIEEGHCDRDQPKACRAGWIDPKGTVVWEPGRRYLGGLAGSVLPPPGWTVEERGKELRLTLPAEAAGTRYPLVVMLRRYELGKALTLDQAVEKLSAELTASGRQFKRLELGATKVGEQAAKLHVFASDRLQPFEPTLTIKAVQYLLVDGANLYNLAGLAEQDEFLRSRELMESVLKSFRIEIPG